MKVKAVIFDLDGTLTVPCLNFDAIRAEIGGIAGPILEALAQASPTERHRAERILHRHERQAAENSRLNPGVKEILHWLKQQHRRAGLLTRNRRASVRRVCQIHDLNFDAVVSREDGPVKPDPFGVIQACRSMGVEPHETCVVGDYLFDLVAGRRAGAVSVLFSSNENHHDFIAHADHVIADLQELTGVIEMIENTPGRGSTAVGPDLSNIG